MNDINRHSQSWRQCSRELAPRKHVVKMLVIFWSLMFAAVCAAVLVLDRLAGF